MKNYGSKDTMRMDSIKEKSLGDYMKQLLYAYNMACAITEPGKAMARGYAAEETFGEQSAVCQVFFERAYDLSGGQEVRPVASVNPWEETEEGIEAEYNDIPIDEQPSSRRPDRIMFKETDPSPKTPWSILVYLGKINTIKGSGPQFNLYYYKNGTIEVWRTEDGKYRLIFTSNYDPNFGIGTTRTFKYDEKTVEWKMVDYIESSLVANLAPLYGKSLPIYCYD